MSFALTFFAALPAFGLARAKPLPPDPVSHEHTPTARVPTHATQTPPHLPKHNPMRALPCRQPSP